MYISYSKLASRVVSTFFHGRSTCVGLLSSMRVLTKKHYSLKLICRTRLDVAPFRLKKQGLQSVHTCTLKPNSKTMSA